MLNKRFCFIAGTGRTGSHWFDALFRKYASDHLVASFHDGLPKRLKIRQNPSRTLTNYLLNLMIGKPGARVYIECNPALVEWVGLAHLVSSAADVLPADLLTEPARCILLVRHPFGYVKSMKARGYRWDWAKLPGFTGKAQWAKLGQIESYAFAWNWKNRYCLDMVERMDCLPVKFEDVFVGEQFIETVRGIAEHFGFPLSATNEQLRHLRKQRFAVKGGDSQTLTAKEKAAISRICEPMMEAFGYAKGER